MPRKAPSVAKGRRTPQYPCLIAPQSIRYQGQPGGPDTYISPMTYIPSMPVEERRYRVGDRVIFGGDIVVIIVGIGPGMAGPEYIFRTAHGRRQLEPMLMPEDARRVPYTMDDVFRVNLSGRPLVQLTPFGTLEMEAHEEMIDVVNYPISRGPWRCNRNLLEWNPNPELRTSPPTPLRIQNGSFVRILDEGSDYYLHVGVVDSPTSFPSERVMIRVRGMGRRFGINVLEVVTEQEYNEYVNHTRTISGTADYIEQQSERRRNPSNLSNINGISVGAYVKAIRDDFRSTPVEGYLDRFDRLGNRNAYLYQEDGTHLVVLANTIELIEAANTIRRPYLLRIQHMDLDFLLEQENRNRDRDALNSKVKCYTCGTHVTFYSIKNARLYIMNHKGHYTRLVVEGAYNA